MLTYEQKKQRMAELFGVPLDEVPDDLDPATLYFFALTPPRRPHVLAYKLHELADMTDPAWVLRDWVPAGLSVVYAKPKAGKTFWVMTLAVCYAMGLDFFGMQVDPDNTAEPKRRRVLYIAAEGSGKATWRRIERIAAALKIDMDELSKWFEVVATGVKVDSDKSLDDFLLLHPGDRDMIVVDTLARCMQGDENSTIDMNYAVAGLDRIRREMKAVSMIVVHHEGHKEERLRGSIALLGALDCQVRVLRKDGFNYVMVQELREAAVPESNTMVFKLNAAKGVLEVVDNGGALDGCERVMFDTLVEIVRETDGQPVKLSDWWGRLDEVKPDLLATAGKALSDAARRSKWQRLTRGLVKAGTIKVEDGHALPDNPFKDVPLD